MNELENQPAPRKNLLLWPIRFFLHWIIKAVVMVLMLFRVAFRPKPVRYALVLLAIAGFFVYQFALPQIANRSDVAASTLGTRAVSFSGTTISVPAADRLGPSPVVERYLKAQSEFDATGMWEVISDDLKKQLASSNTSVRDLQAELDTAKSTGRSYGQVTYVGGTSLQEGASVYFYVLAVDTPNGTLTVPYAYVVGGDGKIASIQ